ncbi:MAG: hypothetical protein ACRDIE_19885 [Chloroflexota bacterium]
MTIRQAFDPPRLGAMRIEHKAEDSRRKESIRTENGEPAPSIGRQLFRLGISLAAPIALYYGLRAAGVGIYPALIIGAVPPALSVLV